MSRNKKDGLKTRSKRSSGIAYQNKDITSKALGERMKGKTLEAYGLKLPEVVDVRPTNLPAIEANELKLDNLFYFADGSVGIIDYESDSDEENKLKYFGYIARIARRVYNEEKHFRPMRLIIIYTGDVERGTTTPMLELHAVRLRLDEAFLSDLHFGEIKERITGKLSRREALDDVDLAHLILFPLSVPGSEEKQIAIGEAVELAEQIEDPKDRLFVLLGIRTFADKVITPELVKRIEGGIGMVRVIENMIERAEAKERTKAKREIAQNMLDKGHSPEDVASCTGLTMKAVEKLQKSRLQMV